MNSFPNFDRLYEIAESQAGYFTASQAKTAGFSPERLSAHVKNGRLVRVQQGIYRLHHFPGSPYEDLFAAWLRAGPASVISHESALAVYDLSDVLSAQIHLIVPRNSSRRRKGIRQHTTFLPPADITRREGLPITTVERTLMDLIRAGLAEEQIRLAIGEALRRGLTDKNRLREQGQRSSRRTAKLLNIILKEYE